jgi:hypothetical protein
MTAVASRAFPPDKDLSAARRIGAERIEEWQRGLEDPFSPEILEYSKSAIGLGEIDCGLASQDRPPPAKGILAAVRFWLLAGLGWLLLAFSLPLSRGTGKRVDGRRGVALHCELSNRTRHVLEALRTGERVDYILVLGVPRAGLANVRASWTRFLGSPLPPIFRPASLDSLLASGFVAWKSLKRTREMERTCPVRPSVREQLAILTRILLGHASGSWWRRNGCASHITYGHSGTADTILLELAQQSLGCVTLHAVHGLSGGRNFLGRSDIAIFHCGHDAEWHKRLGGYRSCVWVASGKMPWRRGGSGLLLLSSLAHPMYLGWRLHGIAEEWALLEAVACAAASNGIEGPHHWMPHPALQALPVRQREDLYSHATQLGFSLPPSGTHFTAIARKARWIVSSESTVAVELLAEGLLPILWRSPWSPSGSALSRYEPCAENSQDLVQMLRTRDSERLAIYESTWNAVLPGRRPS